MSGPRLAARLLRRGACHRPVRRAGILLAALALVAWTASSAAQLSVQPESLLAFVGTPPCSLASVDIGPAASTGAVVVRPPARCLGGRAALTVVATDGRVLATGEAVVSGAASEIPLSAAIRAADVERVALLIDDRGVPARWTYRPPISTDPGLSVTVGYQTYSPTSFCVTLAVTTDSSVPVTWRVDVDLTARPFNGGHDDTGAYSISGGVASPAGPIVGRTLHVVGDTVTNRTVVRGQTRRVRICDDAASGPALDPAAFRLTVSAPSGTKYYACVDLTLTGTGVDEQYYGWSSLVDVGPLRRFILDRGMIPGLISWSPIEALDVADAGVDARTVTGKGYMAGIRQGQTFSFTACVNGSAP